MIWIEMSRDNIHGGGEWGFTKCLWSPAYKFCKKEGRKIPWLYWSNLLKIQQGDIILHLRGKKHLAAFVGYSIAATDGHETLERPPQGGKWSYASSYFRVLLKDYQYFKKQVKLENFFSIHKNELIKYLKGLSERPVNRFFVYQSNRLQCLNGAYLSKCDEALLSLILRGNDIPNSSSSGKEATPTSEVWRSVKQRIGQIQFSEGVKKNYGYKCCFPGCRIDDPKFLIGSHIARWVDNSEKRGNISNGLCLCVLHDKAFENGYFALDEEYCVILSRKPEIQNSKIFINHIKPFDRKEISCSKIRPDKNSLKEHRYRCKFFND